jgi:hypothetical protein
MSSNHPLPIFGLGLVLAAGAGFWQPTQSREPDNNGTVDESAWKQTEWKYQTTPPTALEEAERVVTEAEIPERALKALRTAAGQYQLEAFEEEIRDNRTFYEGEWRVSGRSQEATVTAEGVLIETEATISAEQVPEAVRKAAAKLIGNAPADFARREFIFYEVKYTRDGEEHEALLSPTGVLIGSETPGQQP